MDFGYKNWGDDSYDSSPNKYGNYGAAKKGGGKGKASTSDFDYDISSDFADSPPFEQRAGKGSRGMTESFGTNRFSTTRTRSSVEDRTREILERNKAVGRATDDAGDGGRMKSFEETYKELMGGLDLKEELGKPKTQTKPEKVDTPASKGSLSVSQSRLDSTLDSPGDSLEISAADLEVGALAARRAQEKAHDRRRRMSLDKAPHTLDQSSFNTLRENASLYAKRGSASPDVNRRRSAGDLGGYAGMQFSSALSSIQKSYEGGDAPKGGTEFARFGSVERSDDDIYRMLNVTGGTTESLKFGSAAPSARNSGQGPAFGGRGGGKETAGRKRGGEGSDGEGDLSDVTQGSKDDDDGLVKPRMAANKPTPSVAAAGTTLAKNLRPADSFYSVPTVHADDEDTGSGSGDSNQAYSPQSRSANSLPFQDAGKGAAATRSGTTGATTAKHVAEEEEDEYSLDDFEPDGNQSSPEKPSARPSVAPSALAAPAATSAAPISTAASRPTLLSSASQGSLPPAQLGLASPPSQKTLTPTSSTASMHSHSHTGAAKSPVATGLTSVEEIMQRWHTADSDFMQRSLQRMTSGDVFTLDEEDTAVKPVQTIIPAKPKEGIAMPSHDSFASVSVSVPEVALTGRATPAVSAAGSVPASASATPAFREGTPTLRDTVTPSPVTTAAPTPVDAVLANAPTSGGPGVAGIAAAARPASSNSDYSSDSAHGADSGRSSPVPDCGKAITATVAGQDHDKTVFDLSDSYPDTQPWAQPAAVPASAVSNATNAGASGSASVVEIPKLFASRPGSTTFMTLDQLPNFDDAPARAEQQPASAAVPAEATAIGSVQPMGFLPRPATATPLSASPSVSAASNRYQDTSDDDTRSHFSNGSHSRRSASPPPDPLEYVSGEPTSGPGQKRGKDRRQSWIAPPKYPFQSAAEDNRPRSAPPRGAKTTEGLPPRKLSANTAAKIQHIKSLPPEERRKQRVLRPTNRPGGSAWAAAPTELSTLRSRTAPLRERELEAIAAQQKSALEVSRLSQDNWRLQRKFERLEREMEELRFSQQSAEVIAAVNAAAGVTAPVTASATTGVTKTAAKRRSPTSLVARIDRSDKGQASKGAVSPVRPASGWRAVDVSGRPVPGIVSATPAQQHLPGGKEKWESEMEEALHRLREENRKLLEREKAVRVREEAVAIREATVEMKEKLVASAGIAKTEQDLQKEFFANEELTFLREREQDLLREVDKLKAALFVHTQDTKAIEDLKLRQSLGLDADLNLEGDYAPLAKKFANTMHKAGTYGPSVLKPQLKAYYTDKGKSKRGETEVEEGVVTVAKADYEKLVEDHANQERLLEAFQKENDRLAQYARAKDTEQQLRSAVFYDEREGLNKQLNRLKNATRASGVNVPDAEAEGGAAAGRKNFDDIPLPTSTKTAEALRMELESDATIRALKERLAEAEQHMGERERDLQVTIEKLRKDNRQLVAELLSAQRQNIPPQDSDYLQLQTENRVLAEEVGHLKGKLEWFAQNQRLLDDATEETQQYRQAVSALKRELVQRGMEGKVVDRVVSSVKHGGYTGGDDSSLMTPGADGPMDKSTISGTGMGRGRIGAGSARNPADVKKIKELEETVKVLQESLRKRFPDSVASLVHAASVSDSVQARQRQKDAEVATMRRELEDLKAQHELRLRSLRQEYERLKLQYEKVNQDLQQYQGTPSALVGAAAEVAHSGLGGLTKGSASSVNAIKTLSQALNKIRELEEEVERVRVFYTKKVEEVQRKGEAQIRALKRGTEPAPLPATAGTAGTGGAPEGASRDSATEAAQQAHQAQQALLVQQLQQQLAQATAAYTERIALLERELMTTAEELGRIKATAGAGPPAPVTEREKYASFIPRPGQIAVPLSPLVGFGPRPGPGGGQHAMMSEGERQQLTALHQARVDELKIHHADLVAQLKAQWTSERDSLQQRLREEEGRCAELRKELFETMRGVAHSSAAAATAGRSAAESARETNLAADANRIMNLEAHIQDLELHTQRRERELLSEIDKAKAEGAIERSRLVSLHAQECREKDEQLVRFQQELAQLVNALRHWKHKSQISVVADASSGTPVPI